MPAPPSAVQGGGWEGLAGEGRCSLLRDGKPGKAISLPPQVSLELSLFPWEHVAHDFASLSLGFLICKMEIMGDLGSSVCV